MDSMFVPEGYTRVYGWSFMYIFSLTLPHSTAVQLAWPDQALHNGGHASHYMVSVLYTRQLVSSPWWLVALQVQLYSRPQICMSTAVLCLVRAFAVDVRPSTDELALLLWCHVSANRTFPWIFMGSRPNSVQHISLLHSILLSSCRQRVWRPALQRCQADFNISHAAASGEPPAVHSTPGVLHGQFGCTD